MDHSIAVVVYLDFSGSIIAGGTKLLMGVTDPLMAEAQAAYLAASLACKLCLSDIILEGDSSIVISCHEERRA